MAVFVIVLEMIQVKNHPHAALPGLAPLLAYAAAAPTPSLLQMSGKGLCLAAR